MKLTKNSESVRNVRISSISSLFKHILAEKMNCVQCFDEFVCIMMCVCWSGSSFAVVGFFSSYFQRSLLECLATKANIQRSNVCLSIKVSSAGSDMLLKPLESVKSALRGLGGDCFLLWYFQCVDEFVQTVIKKCLKINSYDFLGFCSNYSPCFAILLPKSLSPWCKHMVIMTLVVLAFGAFFSPLIPLFGMWLFNVCVLVYKCVYCRVQMKKCRWSWTTVNALLCFSLSFCLSLRICWIIPVHLVVALDCLSWSRGQ